MDQQQYTTLVDVLKQVPDPRKRKGRRHRWLTLLCLIVAAVASAQRTPRAIARWVQEHRAELFAVLPPAVAHLPSDATLRRALARLDVAVLEQALIAFQPPTASPPDAPAEPADTLQGVAIDGKAIVGLGVMGIRATWSVSCSMPMRGCWAKWPSRSSVMSGVRLARCWLGVI